MQNNRNNDNIIQYNDDINYSLNIKKKNNGEQQKKYNKIKWRIDYMLMAFNSPRGHVIFM